jgi:hypothetical protein
MAGEDCRCQTIPCFCADVERDIDFLLAKPQVTMYARYHDAGSCWQLIDALRRRMLSVAAAERKRCADYVRSRGIRERDWVDSQALADELEELAE